MQIKKIINVYNKKELLDNISLIKIERLSNQVITKYDDRVISVANVSKIYEVFDIKSYIINKLDLIEKNFTISSYCLRIYRGIQELILFSDTIEIEGVKFQKTFYILNSSDRSRKLNFNAGLYCESNDFYMVSQIKNLSLIKKHYRGITEAAELVSENISGETFDSQIESLHNLIGHKVGFSKIKECIVTDFDNKSDHLRFDSFRKLLLNSNLSESQNNILRLSSESNTSIGNDFFIDAFLVFQIYMRIFNKEDSHIILRETMKILAITQWSIRNKTLEKLGI